MFLTNAETEKNHDLKCRKISSEACQGIVSKQLEYLHCKFSWFCLEIVQFNRQWIILSEEYFERNSKDQKKIVEPCEQ